MASEYFQLRSRKTLMISQQSDANLLDTHKDRPIIPAGSVLSMQHFFRLFIYFFNFKMPQLVKLSRFAQSLLIKPV